MTFPVWLQTFLDNHKKQLYRIIDSEKIKEIEITTKVTLTDGSIIQLTNKHNTDS
jgi:hypothetical protein